MNKLLKEQALVLRKRGMTYPEISRHLGQRVPKGTLSGWFKELKLTLKQKNKLDENIAKKLKLAQVNGLQALAKRRNIYLRGILSDSQSYIKNLDHTTQKLILSILYLGEGAKYRGTNSLRLGSADPRIIQLYLKLLNNCYEIDPLKVRIRIQCRDDQHPDLLEKYWREIINIPNVRFYPTYVDKRTKGKPTLKPNYNGVCTVEYFNTKIQLELEILSNLIIEALLGNRVDDLEFVSRWIKRGSNDKIARKGP